MKKKGLLISAMMMGTLAISGCNLTNTGNTSESEDTSESENFNPGQGNPGMPGGAGQMSPGGQMSGGESATSQSNLSTSNLERSIQTQNTSDDALITGAESNVDPSNSAINVVGEGDAYNITAGGEYVLTGDFESINIKTYEAVHLYLNNVVITTTGKAISSKGDGVTITLIGDNVIDATSSNKKVVDLAGDSIINGSGTLTIDANASADKNVIGADGCLIIVDATITINDSSKNAIAAYSVIAKDATMVVNDSAKDGIKAEMDDGVTEFTLESGYVYLVNVNYTYTGNGDGIQADTYVSIYGGTYDIYTSTTFVSYSDYQAYLNDTYSGDLDLSELEADDFKYKLSGTTYYRVAKDTVTNNKSGTYAMIQSNKGIKVGEIDYDVTENEITTEHVVYDGDYAIVINGGNFTINSQDDAIHANSGNVIINAGTFNITTLDDGISADYLLQVTGGTINITKSYEGLEGGQVEIEGGTINVVASDDGVNAASNYVSASNNHIIVSGGTLSVNASGDGIDSNGTILINGGSVTVAGATSGGNGILDSGDGNVGGILVNGGTLVAYGGSDMLETPASNSTQTYLVYTGTNLASGSVITVKDSSGNTVMSFTLNKQASALILSSDDIVNGQTYTIYSGSNSIGTVTAGTTSTMNNGQFTGPGGNFNQGGGNFTPPQDNRNQNRGMMPPGMDNMQGRDPGNVDFTTEGTRS